MTGEKRHWTIGHADRLRARGWTEIKPTGKAFILPMGRPAPVEGVVESSRTPLDPEVLERLKARRRPPGGQPAPNPTASPSPPSPLDSAVAQFIDHALSIVVYGGIVLLLRWALRAIGWMS